MTFVGILRPLLILQQATQYRLLACVPICHHTERGTSHLWWDTFFLRLEHDQPQQHFWQPLRDTAHFNEKKSSRCTSFTYKNVYLNGAQPRVVFILETANVQVCPILIVFEQLCLKNTNLLINMSNDQLPSDGPYVCYKKIPMTLGCELQWLAKSVATFISTTEDEVWS